MFGFSLVSSLDACIRQQRTRCPSSCDPSLEQWNLPQRIESCHNKRRESPGCELKHRFDPGRSRTRKSNRFRPDPGDTFQLEAATGVEIPVLRRESPREDKSSQTSCETVHRSTTGQLHDRTLNSSLYFQHDKKEGIWDVESGCVTKNRTFQYHQIFREEVFWRLI